MILKPKVLIDIKTAKHGPFRRAQKRLNLYSSRRLNLYLIDVIKPIVVLVISIYLVLGSVIAPISPHSFASQDVQEERQALETQLAELERQIDEQEITISEYRTKRKTLQGEINSLDAKIRKLSLQIRASNVSINNIGGDIKGTESQITTTKKQLENNREALTQLIRQLDEHDRSTLFEIILQNKKLSDFFGDINDLLEVQNSVNLAVSKITELRNQLINDKERLALRLNDVESLKRYQAAQRDAVKQTKSKKDNLLTQTKGNEEKYQALLKKTKENASKIRNLLFTFLGGGEMTFENAYKFAKFAEDSTGVEAALILAVLDRESALGSNVGKCEYDVNPYYPAKASNPTAMHPTRDIPVFLDIVKELGISKNVPVSCPIPRDGAYGGAMGPAQFLPSTWKLYEKKIRNLTGNTPSPWNNGHAILATALYLKDAINSRSCQQYVSSNKNIVSEDILKFRCAGGAYYGGLGNWRRYRLTYGDSVAQKAKSFENDIKVLRGA